MKNKPSQNYFLQNLQLQKYLPSNDNNRIEDFILPITSQIGNKYVVQDRIQKQQIQPEKAKQKSLFEDYVIKIKQKILKRKIILLILNILLTISTLVFLIWLIIGQTSGTDESLSTIEKLFSTNNQISTLVCGSIIFSMSVIFSIVIIKGKVLLLHCYWITCLVFLIIFSLVATSAYSIINSSCEQPSNYIMQQIKLNSISAVGLYCSSSCPCQMVHNYSLSIKTFYSRVQDCPGWTSTVYNNFFSIIQSRMQCSGWCHLNQISYFTFIANQITPNSKKTCFNAIQQKLSSELQYIKVLSMIVCGMIIVVIFYTNYYIFMEKQDEQKQIKKIKRKIKIVTRKMQNQLLTSKRLLN